MPVTPHSAQIFADGFLISKKRSVGVEAEVRRWSGNILIDASPSIIRFGDVSPSSAGQTSTKGEQTRIPLRFLASRICFDDAQLLTSELDRLQLLFAFLVVLPSPRIEFPSSSTLDRPLSVCSTKCVSFNVQSGGGKEAKCTE